MSNDELTMSNEEVSIAVINQAFDYEKMKEEAITFITPYTNMVITEDNLKEASDARAVINKKIKEIDAERISIKKIWNDPIIKMEAEVKKVLDVYSAGIKTIDDVLKSYEAERIEKVRIEINNHFASLGFDFIPLNRIYDDRWTNKGMANTWKIDMENKIFIIKQGIELIKTVGLDETALTIALNRYKETLQTADSISYARKVTEPIPERITPTAPAMKPQPVVEIVEVIKTYGISFDSAIDFMEAVNVLTEAGINFKVVQ